jgi:hypothetical protein
LTYIEQLAHQIRSSTPGDLVPDDDADRLFLIYAALALAKGQDVTRRDVHNAWAAWMAAREPAHESIRPFDELDEATKNEDDPFVAAIKRSVGQNVYPRDHRL